jgi:hypothetical protein
VKLAATSWPTKTRKKIWRPFSCFEKLKIGGQCYNRRFWPILTTFRRKCIAQCIGDSLEVQRDDCFLCMDGCILSQHCQ